MNGSLDKIILHTVAAASLLAFPDSKTLHTSNNSTKVVCITGHGALHTCTDSINIMGPCTRIQTASTSWGPYTYTDSINIMVPCTRIQTASTSWGPAHMHRQHQHHGALHTYTDGINIVGPCTHVQTASASWGPAHTYRQHEHAGACRKETSCCGWGSARRKTACCWHLLRARPCVYARMTQRCAPSAAPPNPSGWVLAVSTDSFRFSFMLQGFLRFYASSTMGGVNPA